MDLAGGMFAAGQVLALKLMSEMKSKVMTIAKIVTALLGTGLNILGAFYFGLVGVVAALVMFSSNYLYWMAWIAQHPPVSPIIIGHHENEKQTKTNKTKQTNHA